MADKKRAAALKELDAIGFDELDDFLAETIHTAFRKGIDHPQSMVIWRAIRELPSDQWSTGIEWMIWALRVSTDREKK